MSIRSISAIRLLGNCLLACCSAALTTLLYNYFHQEECEVIFFYGYGLICSSHHNIDETTTTALTNVESCCLCKLNKIVEWLDESKKTLDVCMYMLSHDLLSNAIIKAHKRGVSVRVIVNEDNTNTWTLSNVGIPKRAKKNEYLANLMHHKFVIIDNKKLITGSLNWNVQSVRANWEDTFITNNCKIVDTFRQEFQRLWKQFD